MVPVLVFDIETIPSRKKLGKKSYAEYKKLMAAQIKKHYPTGQCTYSEAKKLRGLVMATSPFLSEIIVIGLHMVKDGRSESIAIVNDSSEKSVLERFWEIVAKFPSNGLFVSFNGLEFDVPLIIKKSMLHRIPITNNKFLDQKRFSTAPHFDVRLVFGNHDKFAQGSLDLICEFLNVPSPKEGEVKASDIESAFNSGKLKEIAEYCVRDVEATYKVFEILFQYAYKPNTYKH